MIYSIPYTLTALLILIAQVEGYRLILLWRATTLEVTNDFGRVENVFPKFKRS